MKPLLSYSQPKSYLTGVDWFVRALDCRTEKITGSGNYSQVVLTLQGQPDQQLLRKKLDALLDNNPLIAGRCRRNLLNLAPYWHISRNVDSRAIRLDMHEAEEESDADEVIGKLGDAVNTPLAEDENIAFSLTRHRDRSYLAMQFNHQFLDAVGAERLLEHISEGSDKPLNPGVRPAHLNRWRDKFKSGQVVNREILALREDQPPASIVLTEGKRNGIWRTRFKRKTYSAVETAAISARADKCAGYLLLLPYLLGVSVSAFDAACRGKGTIGGSYIVPVSVDARAADENEDTIFFNHLSFNFYRFSSESADKLTALWESAVAQMYSHVQKRVAQHVANAGMLMRILPAAWLGKLMTLPLGGRIGSIYFAFVGRGGYESDRFMGVPIERILHMPRIPAPPGIGVIVTRYGQQLTVTLSYLDGMLDESTAARFLHNIDAELMKED